MSVEEAEQIFEQALTHVAPSLVRCQLLEEATRIAEREGCLETAAYYWTVLESSYLLAGKTSEAIAMFAKCLQYADAHPEFTPYFDHVLQRYAEICVTLARQVNVPCKEVESMFADCQRRFQWHGVGMRLFYHSRWRAHLDMGQVDTATSYFTRWQATPRDKWAYSPGIEEDSELWYYSIIGQSELMRSRARQLLASNLLDDYRYIIPYIYDRLHELSCTTDNMARAEEEITQIRAQCRGARPLADIQPFIRHALLTGNFDEGLDWIRSHALPLEKGGDYQDQLESASLAAELLRRAAPTTPTLQLADSPLRELSQADGTFRTEEVASWMEELATNLAEKFDERNNNNFRQNRKRDLQSIGR
jgi:tetratricopeptide (TPR) repeat protein